MRRSGHRGEALVCGGVTALPVPERLGGDGVGLFEVGAAGVGRHGAVTPALATLGARVVPLLELASASNRTSWPGGQEEY